MPFDDLFGLRCHGIKLAIGAFAVYCVAVPGSSAGARRCVARRETLFRSHSRKPRSGMPVSDAEVWPCWCDTVRLVPSIDKEPLVQMTDRVIVESSCPSATRNNGADWRSVLNRRNGSESWSGPSGEGGMETLQSAFH
ncbi:hypothetical protein BU23DRAFT_570477 [Bimuria novae-zelandiae CBS 107.79]|uniref:Uncharacterized protein n=1 Tax=Bimuria novae-zelandiae CBS 107.79 TaxID=1447943 RepID=A0A6A5V410_9PLEO|nr:hypothetical protein BU23DRAFT_570477 [Bimuria novae-zelandiae CBS 107.79]